MSVLALRLGGPLQSWGGSQRLDRYRRTEPFPTKSAVVGLLAAALGRTRSESVEDITGLRFGVRGDRPGEVIRDFHTLSSLFDEKRRFAPEGGRLPTASGSYRPTAASTHVTERFYLTDACFVAGLEGEMPVLEKLDEALRRPAFPLFLGRRSCPPDHPIRLGIHEGTLLEALSIIPWQPGAGREEPAAVVTCEAVVEDPDGDREVIDEVRSFHPVYRAYSRRRVRHYYLDVPNPSVAEPERGDPMALLEEV